MEELHKILESIFSNGVALVFSGAIAFLFLLAIGNHFRSSARNANFDRSAPTLFTTIGVLGTFTGIFLGLLNFDVENISESVPLLLEGLRIAFVTSIVGMLATILFKVIQAVLPHTDEGEAPTPEAILGTLKDIRHEAGEAAARQTAALSELRDAISADGESSLLTQLQKVRATTQDGLDALAKEFRDFATTMAENNSKALIEALEQVIRDFNTQLNEQFGDNFKQLNQAVDALLEWQKNYKEHVERLEEQFARSLQSIEEAEASLQEISERAKTIPDTMEKLAPVMHGLESQVAALQNHLEALSELRDKAIEAFPVIETNLSKITTDLTTHVQECLEQTSRALDQQRNGNAELVSGYEELRKSAETAQEAFINDLTKMLSQTEEAINEQMNALDQQMQEELERVLTTFGRNLASLSEKFVEDYSPLTDRLRELVRVAGRV